MALGRPVRQECFIGFEFINNVNFILIFLPSNVTSSESTLMLTTLYRHDAINKYHQK